MKTETYVREVTLPVAAADAFAWHARPGTLERLLPPWQDVRVVSRVGGLEDGGRVELSVPVGPLRRTWLAEHRNVDPPRRFRDVSLRGPFPFWDHQHGLEPRGENECILTDRIEYACPGGLLGRMLGGGYVRHALERMFRYRHDTTAADLAMHARYADRLRMKV
ncbi:MAG: SRPBCC family protein, partial [Patescibacteria group bacterium]|nr:SRPBCC family protein [Patescibacteria group bacterium]